MKLSWNNPSIRTLPILPFTILAMSCPRRWLLPLALCPSWPQTAICWRCIVASMGDPASGTPSPAPHWSVTCTRTPGKPADTSLFFTDRTQFLLVLNVQDPSVPAASRVPTQGSMIIKQYQETHSGNTNHYIDIPFELSFKYVKTRRCMSSSTSPMFTRVFGFIPKGVHTNAYSWFELCFVSFALTNRLARQFIMAPNCHPFQLIQYWVSVKLVIVPHPCFYIDK